MNKNNIFKKNNMQLIDVKVITSLIITVMLLFSIFIIQDSIISNTEEDSLTNDVQRTILPSDNFDSKLFGSSDYITIDDPTGQLENYTIDETAGMIELNSSRGQSYRHFYNTTSYRYHYESDILVIKPDVIDGTDWVTLDEFPITFFIRTANNKTLYASTPNEAATILSNQENITLVGIESFIGSAAFYINSQDNDWGHGQTVFYPRLSTGYIPEIDSPLYSWFAHLFVQDGETVYDKIINDNLLFPSETQPPTVQFDKDNDYFKIWYDLNDITIFSQTFDLTIGIKYSLLDGKFHTINNITCKTMDYDDIGFAYDIFCSEFDRINPTSPTIILENETTGIAKDLTEEWDAEVLLGNVSSSFSLIDSDKEGFTFDYSDMSLAGFTEKYFSVNNQLLPNNKNYNILRVGMSGLGKYTKGTTIEIDPIFSSTISDNNDVSLEILRVSPYTKTKKTDYNWIGFTDGDDKEYCSYLSWDTGITEDIDSILDSNLHLECQSSTFDYGVPRLKLMEQYTGSSPNENDDANTLDSYYQYSAYVASGSSSYLNPVTSEAENKDVDSYIDYWADNKDTDSVVKFRIKEYYADDDEYCKYYTGGSSGNEPTLEFDYVMLTDEFVNTGFELDSTGEITNPGNITGWALAYDNGGSYYIEDDDTNCLRIVNADYYNDYGGFMQQFYYDYNDEDGGDIISGDLKLDLAGSLNAQMAYIGYYFYDENDSQMASVTFYIREDYQSYSNTSNQLYFNLSTYSANSIDWINNGYSSGWRSYRKNLTECLTTDGTFDALNDTSERDDIEYVEVRACLFTSSSTAAEGWFDNITISSIHLASDATRTMNIYNEDYEQFIENIEDEINTEYGTNPSKAEISEGIYDYIRDLKDDLDEIHDTSKWTELENIMLILEDSDILDDCGQYAILTSAVGRAFGIESRIIFVVYASGTTNHLFAEFYWSSDWHNVDPDIGYFDDQSGFADYIDSTANTDYKIIYEFYQAADPRSDTTHLSSSRVYYREYYDHNYIQV